MADAKKCDRCQKYYDDYKVKVKTFAGGDAPYRQVNRIKLGDSFNVYFGYDFCPECMKEFFGFIRMPYEMFDFGGDDK